MIFVLMCMVCMLVKSETLLVSALFVVRGYVRVSWLNPIRSWDGHSLPLGSSLAEGSRLLRRYEKGRLENLRYSAFALVGLSEISLGCMVVKLVRDLCHFQVLRCFSLWCSSARCWVTDFLLVGRSSYWKRTFLPPSFYGWVMYRFNLSFCWELYLWK